MGRSPTPRQMAGAAHSMVLRSDLFEIRWPPIGQSGAFAWSDCHSGTGLPHADGHCCTWMDMVGHGKIWMDMDRDGEAWMDMDGHGWTDTEHLYSSGAGYLYKFGTVYMYSFVKTVLNFTGQYSFSTVHLYIFGTVLSKLYRNCIGQYSFGTV